MKIDVIIPVYKPGAELFTLLDKLENQTVPVHRIILMNTEDNLREEASEHTGHKEENVGTDWKK